MGSELKYPQLVIQRYDELSRIPNAVFVLAWLYRSSSIVKSINSGRIRIKYTATRWQNIFDPGGGNGLNPVV